MPITVPTTEFVGLLNDVAPFALDDPEFPKLCCVRVAWDGEMLNVQAHDGNHMAWSRWSPDDDPAGDAQESMLDPWGSNDSPWAVVVSLANAKALAKLFKLPDKVMWTPLTIGVHLSGALRVARARVPGLMAIETTVEETAAAGDFPDFADVFAQVGRPEPVEQLAFNALQLSHFGTVRPRGPMELTFCGPRSAVLIRIGERFTGAVSPVRAAERRLQVAA